MKKIASFVCGTVLAATAGLAGASDAVNLSENQLDAVTSGFYYYWPSNTASAGAHALAFGHNTSTSTFTGTLTTPGFSGSYSSSASSTSSPCWSGCWYH